MEDDDYSEPPPPTAERVARRAIILSVISCRGIMEGNQDIDPDAADLAERAHDWLKALHIDEEWSDRERELLMEPFGTLGLKKRVNAAWLSEAMTVLAWALGKIELPGFDQKCDPGAVAKSLGFLEARGHTVFAAPALLSADALGEYNEFIYNVHWRVRDYSINRNAYDFELLARKAWGDPILRHGLKIEDKDICIAGTPLSKASERDVQFLSSITRERHRASNWLIGYASENFYEVTTDT